MKKETLIPIFAAIFLLVGLANVSAAYIKTTPEQPVWIADGITEYTAYVYIDNHGLGGEPTDAVEWKFINTPNLDFVNASLPDYNDFFEGIDMSPGFNFVSPPGQMSMRAVEVPGTGPVDHSGYLGFYKFTVPLGTTPGVYHFDLTNTFLWDDSFPQSQPQDHDVLYDTFRIRPPHPPVYRVEAAGHVVPISAQPIDP